MKKILVIPLAGHGRRFKSMGYVLPKQMLQVDEYTALEHSLRSINMEDYKTFFILRNDQKLLASFIHEICKNYDFEIKTIEKETRGSVETVLEIEDLVDPNSNFTVFTMDVTFNPTFSPEVFPIESDGGLLTFKSNSQNYSYARLLEDGTVVETAEKIVISEHAIAGIYYFKKAKYFFEFAQQMILEENVSAGEFYIAPLFNDLISAGLNIQAKPVEEFFVFGTPREYEFYKNHIIRSLNKKIIGLCADHSGYEAKERIKNFLRKQQIRFIDYGTHSHKDCDYNDSVNLAAEALKTREIDFAIGSCRSGQGIAIAANAHPEVIASLIYDLESAKFAVKHNCTNFASIPSSIWENSETLQEIIGTLIETRFEGGRHQERLMKVLDVKNNA